MASIKVATIEDVLNRYSGLLLVLILLVLLLFCSHNGGVTPLCNYHAIFVFVSVNPR